MSDSRTLLRPDEDPRHEIALQLGSRLMALLKTGRAYSVEHVTFKQQLENYLALLETVFRDTGVARFDAPEGDLCLNGERLPYRPHMFRAIQQLALEFEARAIAGLEFAPGLTLPEMTTFMAYFLPGERWKGADLVNACENAGLVNVRPLPRASADAARTVEVAAGAVPETLHAARAAWITWLDCARSVLTGDALDQGVELRHMKRLVQPLVDDVLAADEVAAALAGVTPGEPAWIHGAHVSLTALCIGERLGLSRHDLAEVAVSALLHDLGHAWNRDAAPADTQADPAWHAREGVRRLAWATTLNRTSLSAMRTVLEHHAWPDSPTSGATRPPALHSQLVAVADAYVSLLSAGLTPATALAPSSALARVIGPLADGWHPALPVALVRAVGLYPPGQVVELDDGSLARATAPDRAAPEQPWVEMLTDERGASVVLMRREPIRFPTGRRVTRALPRPEWPDAGPLRPAA